MSGAKQPSEIRTATPEIGEHAPSEQPSTEFAARAKATWARLIRKVYEADLPRALALAAMRGTGA